jgi:hypothetical protein
MSALDPEKGQAELERALGQSKRLTDYSDGTAQRFVRELGWHGFLWIIRERLDTIYPAPGFRATTYGVLWGGEHGGEDIDAGVKWATLLDLALEQLPKETK